MTDPWQCPEEFEKLARQLGQNDPHEQRIGKPRDSDNGPEVVPRGTLALAFVVGSLLAAVVVVWLSR